MLGTMTCGVQCLHAGGAGVLMDGGKVSWEPLSLNQPPQPLLPFLGWLLSCGRSKLLHSRLPFRPHNPQGPEGFV